MICSPIAHGRKWQLNGTYERRYWFIPLRPRQGTMKFMSGRNSCSLIDWTSFEDCRGPRLRYTFQYSRRPWSASAAEPQCKPWHSRGGVGVECRVNFLTCLVAEPPGSVTGASEMIDRFAFVPTTKLLLPGSDCWIVILLLAAVGVVTVDPPFPPDAVDKLCWLPEPLFCNIADCTSGTVSCKFIETRFSSLIFPRSGVADSRKKQNATENHLLDDSMVSIDAVLRLH